MKKLVTDNYVINYEPQLQHFIEKTVAYAENKRKEFAKIFKCNDKEVGVVKASFFTNHDNFINYIKSVSGGRCPPDWATGCFYNGEIQILVDLSNPSKKMNTLAHETLHLFFDKNIYKKYKINRVNWLDESFAVYLDGKLDTMSASEFATRVDAISNISKNFDMAILADYNKVKTAEYNGYHMFGIIGKFIFENHLEQEYLTLIKTNRDKIVEIGKNILQTAVNYFKEQYN